MSVFIHHVLHYKKNIIMMMFMTIICGFLFGFYQYHLCSNTILDYMKNLFYLNDESYTNHYSLYMIESILFIIICTYLSTSYIGFIGILIILFFKGLQISFSLIYVYTSISLNISIIISLLIELFIEIIYIFIYALNCLHLSLYVTYVTFYSKQLLDIKSITNYLLNYLIISFILLTISLSFRIYIIPMF